MRNSVAVLFASGLLVSCASVPSPARDAGGAPEPFAMPPRPTIEWIAGEDVGWVRDNHACLTPDGQRRLLRYVLALERALEERGGVRGGAE